MQSISQKNNIALYRKLCLIPHTTIGEIAYKKEGDTDMITSRAILHLNKRSYRTLKICCEKENEDVTPFSFCFLTKRGKERRRLSRGSFRR